MNYGKSRASALAAETAVRLGRRVLWCRADGNFTGSMEGDEVVWTRVPARPETISIFDDPCMNDEADT